MLLVPEGEEEGNGEEDVEDEEDDVTPGDKLDGRDLEDDALALHLHCGLVVEQDATGLQHSLDMLALFHFHLNNVSKFRKKG